MRFTFPGTITHRGPRSIWEDLNNALQHWPCCRPLDRINVRPPRSAANEAWNFSAFFQTPERDHHEHHLLQLWDSLLRFAIDVGALPCSRMECPSLHASWLLQEDQSLTLNFADFSLAIPPIPLLRSELRTSGVGSVGC